jgi:hypothetical protein
MWLVSVVGRRLAGCDLSLHTLLTMHGHRNLKLPTSSVSSSSLLCMLRHVGVKKPVVCVVALLQLVMVCYETILIF